VQTNIRFEGVPELSPLISDWCTRRGSPCGWGGNPYHVKVVTNNMADSIQNCWI
jgi:hypothetical protein